MVTKLIIKRKLSGELECLGSTVLEELVSHLNEVTGCLKDELTRQNVSSFDIEQAIQRVTYERIREAIARGEIEIIAEGPPAAHTESYVVSPPTRTYKTAEKQRPPQIATLLLCLFLSANDRYNMLGDLDEKFPKWVERHGLRMARLIYLKDACTTIYPSVQKLWWRIFKLLAKVGGIAGLVEIIRHIRFW
jgi:hypothetical protein